MKKTEHGAQKMMSELNQQQGVCPLCGGDRLSRIYPIDLAYAAGMAGYLEDSNIGVAQCIACDHQFISPVPTVNFLEAFYASYMSEAKRGFYEQRYANIIPAAFRDYYGRWLDQVRIFRQGRTGSLLDIGCGLGMFLRLAKEKEFQVTGIEPNAEAAKYLGREYGIEVSNTLLENYRGRQRFDVVTMWDLLEHLADPARAISMVKMLLNPGGILVLEIPVRDSLLHWIAKLSYIISFGLIKRPLYLTYGVHHLQYFSERSILDLLSDSGFEIVACYRNATDIESVRRKPGHGLLSQIKIGMYNAAISALLSLARMTGRQNKVVVFSRVKNKHV